MITTKPQGDSIRIPPDAEYRLVGCGINGGYLRIRGDDISVALQDGATTAITCTFVVHANLAGSPKPMKSCNKSSLARFLQLTLQGLVRCMQVWCEQLLINLRARIEIMKVLKSICVAGVMTAASTTAVAEVTANAGATNNYIWRGLTQTTNQAAVQGGIDYTHESGFYAGTWVSNVQYAADDIYSYEHDLYLGFSGGDEITYDIGWLYYNYDDAARYDFHEIYGTAGWKNLSFSAWILSGTEADAPVGADFDFGSTYYASLDYGFELNNGFGIGLHVGRHAGDFSEAFNGVPGDYTDYNINFSVKDFTFMITQTDLDDAGFDNLDNDSVKFVIGYSMEFGLGD